MCLLIAFAWNSCRHDATHSTMWEDGRLRLAGHFSLVLTLAIGNRPMALLLTLMRSWVWLRAPHVEGG